jgi:hypothetical protein
LVTTVWFSDSHEGQEGVFPATALDRVELKETVAKKSGTARKKSAK